ncbi:MAG: hypothetical protein Q4B40_04245 [Clostridia bacterium]|nr:hypothetical protein [Clostridia bacterium]
MIKIINKKLFPYFCIFLIIMLIISPEISHDGVIKGLLISANVIIPSLFPFTVCVLLLLKSQISIKNKFLNNLTYKLFGFEFDIFIIFVLSLIGGYPVGAKLISELYSQKSINKTAANILLIYCVNAGPAFILSAVGCGMFSSYKIGVILLLSHIFSSILIAILLSAKLKKIKFNNTAKINTKSFSEIFVSCVADATKSMIQICGFIVIFSAINAYLEYFFKNYAIINKLTYFVEATSGISKTNNIIFVSFLLGFAGISIWFQIFSITKDIKIKYLNFIFGRFLHGTISSILTFSLLKIFKINITVFSSNSVITASCFCTNLSLSISLFIMLLIFLIYLSTKNSSRKIIDDMV